MSVRDDARLALRNLRAAPSYAFAAVLTLGLAIGANSAIFSAVYGIILRPLPIRAPGDVIVAWESDPLRGTPVVEVTYNQYRTWSGETHSFTDLAVMGSSTWSTVLEGRGDPVRLASTAVSSTFFPMLGATPQIGRVFDASDDDEKNGRVAILSDGVWRGRFGADGSVIGSHVVLDGVAHTIVGIMPRDFDFPRGTDVWLPVVPAFRELSATLKTDVFENVRVLFLVGRLRPDARVPSARDDLDAVSARHPSRPAVQRKTVVTPLLDHLLGPLRAGLWWLLAGAGILLMLACANVSGLALTRATLRRREHAVRLALGATRTQLARGWLAEITLVALAGGALGLLSAGWLLSAIVRLAPDDAPRVGDVAIDVPVAAFTLLLVVLTALLCSGAAIVQAARAPLGELLADGAHATAGPSATRTRSTLVVAQIGLAVVLLISAGLVARSFGNLRQLDLGFDPTSVLTMQVEPGAAPALSREWFADVLERVEALPGVESAGAVFLRPLAYGAIGIDSSVILEGQPETLPEALEAIARNPKLNFQIATPGYFRAMRIPLLRGRLFDDRDRTGAPRVVVIGERAAARLWPGDDPIGKRINTPDPQPQGLSSAWHTVIGVVKDVHYRGIGDVRLDVYAPAAQSQQRPEYLIVRTTVEPLGIAAAAQATVRAMDRKAVIGGVLTLDSVVTRALAPWRLSTWILVMFAAIAFALAIVGLVGLMMLEVTHRRREFSVRLALGADTRHLRNAVLRVALTRSAYGVVIGVAGALAITRGMHALLVGVTPADPSIYAAVVGMVLVIVAAVSLLPALRAAATDPIEILKRG